MHIPSYITKVLDILYTHGFEGYLVGGCVRDALMGKKCSDFDIATNATPAEMLDIFDGMKIIETGLKHGTVTVVSDGENVEITTYRIDGKYLDNRRPDGVTFTRSLGEDLSRRDFTINALAYSQKDGVVDLFDGKGDLRSSLIRCVGDPDTRFGEDALRIMRALRFSSVLGFDIHKDTAKSILSNRHLLKNISSERIYQELKKLICGNGAGEVITSFAEVFFTLFPPFASDKEAFVFNASRLCFATPCHVCRFAVLLWGCSESVVRDFMTFLKCDNDTKESVITLCRYANQELIKDKIFVRKLMSVLDDREVGYLFEINKAHSDDFDYDGFMELFTEQKDSKFCVTTAMLCITGNDLADMGIKKGPKIGAALGDILNAVIEERCENTPRAIEKFVRKNMSKYE